MDLVLRSKLVYPCKEEEAGTFEEEPSAIVTKM